MLIGLHGPKGSGKDTVARLLMEMFPERQWERRAFGDKLKEVVARTFNIDVDTVDWLKLKESRARIEVRYDTPMGAQAVCSLTMRQYLQRFATEGVRGVLGDNVWINATLPNPRSRSAWHVVDSQDVPDGFIGVAVRPQHWLPFHHDKHIVVTDVRFPHEAQRVLDLEGQIWAINYKDYTLEHSSEVPLPCEMISKWIGNYTRDDDFETLRHNICKSLETRYEEPVLDQA